MSSIVRSVLIVGSKRPGALEFAYERAIRRLGVPVVDHIDPEHPVLALKRNRVVNRLTQAAQAKLVGRHLLQYMRRSGACYEAIMVFKGMSISPESLVRCKARTPLSTWINLNPDDPFNFASRGTTNDNVVRSIRHYDIYVTWRKRLIPAIHDSGCSSVLSLPFGYDADEHFRSHAIDENLATTATFIGSWDRARENLLTAVADFPLRVYGNGWDRVSVRSPLRAKVRPGGIYGDSLRRIVSSSAVSLNFLRPQNADSHNMRTFEIPAMGGLMLTSHSEEQGQFFPEGEACLMFRDALHLRNQLARALDGKINVASVRQFAHGRAAGNSYDDRARSLLEAVTAFRETKKLPLKSE